MPFPPEFWKTVYQGLNGRIQGYLAQFNRGLGILCIGLLVNALGASLSIPFIAIYFHAQLGLSLSQIGVFFGAIAVVRAVFQVGGGELSDYIERRPLMFYLQVIRAGVFLFIALAVYRNWGFWAIGISFLISSIFGALFQPIANAMVADLLPAESRLDGYALARSAMNLGWAIGPAIGGFLAEQSFGLMFAISAIITLASGIVFGVFFPHSKGARRQKSFTFSDLISVKNDSHLAAHCVLAFFLYLVVAQLIAPFSVYTVEIAKIAKNELGLLYMFNGLMIVFLQVPITRLLSRTRLTIQMACGAFLYAVGYGMVGLHGGFGYFILAITVVTIGEMFVSPPSLTLTSRLAPTGRMGRYMGVFGLFLTAGWSFGPVYGGTILDRFAYSPALAWIFIASLAALSGTGYLVFTRRLPDVFNRKPEKD